MCDNGNPGLDAPVHFWITHECSDSRLKLLLLTFDYVHFDYEIFILFTHA